MKLQVVLDLIPTYFGFYVWGLNTLSWHERSQVAAQALPLLGPLPGLGGALAIVPGSRGDLERCGVKEEGEWDNAGIT